MKLVKRLCVNGQTLGLIHDDVRLDLKNPGRATFVIRSSQPLTKHITFDVGWNESQVFRVFTGTIESIITINPQQQKLFCRELTSVLNQNIYMALRNVTLSDVVADLYAKTYLNFTLPDKPYCQQTSPFFYHLGDGCGLMDQLGRVYQIQDFMWQQQGDGTVYVGSWHDSKWAQHPIELPDKLFTNHLSNNSAKMLIIPSIRPGVKFNRGIISSVQLLKNDMVITWKPSRA